MTILRFLPDGWAILHAHLIAIVEIAVRGLRVLCTSAGGSQCDDNQPEEERAHGGVSHRNNVTPRARVGPRKYGAIGSWLLAKPGACQGQVVQETKPRAKSQEPRAKSQEPIPPTWAWSSVTFS